MQPLRRAILTTLTTLTLVFSAVMVPQPAQALYVVDLGDTISIDVSNAQQYSYSGTLRPDGIITLPLLGDLEVRGLTTDQIKERYLLRVRKVVQDPLITVRVTGYRPRTVMVMGEVGRAGAIDITRADQTVLDSIISAGGLSDHAAGWDVVLMRGSYTSPRRIPLDIQKMLKTADLSGNIKVEPGDRILVPRSPWPTWQDYVWTFQGVSYGVSVVLLAMTLNQRFNNATSP